MNSSVCILYFFFLHVLVSYYYAEKKESEEKNEDCATTVHDCENLKKNKKKTECKPWEDLAQV